MILEFEDFVEKYKPLHNDFLGEANYDGLMFEIDDKSVHKYGKEHGFGFIWTLITGENNNTCLVPGYHIVNRDGYFICSEPWEDDKIEIILEDFITVPDAIAYAKEYIEENIIEEEEMDFEDYLGLEQFFQGQG